LSSLMKSLAWYVAVIRLTLSMEAIDAALSVFRVHSTLARRERDYLVHWSAPRE
jgi:hypothetical protein